MTKRWMCSLRVWMKLARNSCMQLCFLIITMIIVQVFMQSYSCRENHARGWAAGNATHTGTSGQVTWHPSLSTQANRIRSELSLLTIAVGWRLAAAWMCGLLTSLQCLAAISAWISCPVRLSSEGEHAFSNGSRSATMGTMEKFLCKTENNKVWLVSCLLEWNVRSGAERSLLCLVNLPVITRHSACICVPRSVSMRRPTSYNVTIETDKGFARDKMFARTMNWTRDFWYKAR